MAYCIYLWKKYVQKVLEHFNMQKGKALTTPLPTYLKLSKDDCPKLIEEKATMAKIPYASACGSVMHVASWPSHSHSHVRQVWGVRAHVSTQPYKNITSLALNWVLY